MSYNTNQKSLQLRHFIVTLRKENPDLTLQQIGITVNRTRERVRQILVSEGIETRSAKRVESASRPNPICRVCHKEIRIAKNSYAHRRVYCDECVSDNSDKIDMGLRRRRIPRIDVSCPYCHTVINMRETLYERNKLKNTNIFCSRSCRSRYMWQQQIVKNVGGRIVKVRLGRNSDESE